jgi:hypothetical protein
MVTALSLFSVTKDLSSLSRPELDVEKERILTSISALTAESQIGEFLKKVYADIPNP